MVNKLNDLINTLKKEFAFFLSISLGIFLFILFFQPFGPEGFNFNNKLTFVSGLGGIVFLIMVLVWIILPMLIPKFASHEQMSGLSSFLKGFSMVALSSVAFAFYLKAIGQLEITFYLMFKVVLLNLTPVIILRIRDRYHDLIKSIDDLKRENKSIVKQLDRYNEIELNQTIRLKSEGSTENIQVFLKDIAYFRSSDNYVEFQLKEGDSFNKKLIRNTLKSIELQLEPYSNFVRCHRTCIVNIHQVKDLKRSTNNYELILNEIEEVLPVSRQYLLKIRELI